MAVCWPTRRRADEVGQGPAPASAGPWGEAGWCPSLVVSSALFECVGDRQVARDERAGQEQAHRGETLWVPRTPSAQLKRPAGTHG